MSEFFDGLFNILYAFFGFPLLLIILIIIAIIVSQRRRKKRMKQEDWLGHSPVEKIEKENQKNNKKQMKRIIFKVMISLQTAFELRPNCYPYLTGGVFLCLQFGFYINRFSLQSVKSPLLNRLMETRCETLLRDQLKGESTGERRGESPPGSIHSG